MASNDHAVTRRRLLQVGAGLAAGAGFSAPTRARQNRGNGHPNSTKRHRYFIHHETGRPDAAADAATAASGRVQHRYANHGFIAADLPPQAADNIPHARAVPDQRVSVDTQSTTSSDSLADSRPWGVDRIEAPDAHMLGYTGKDIDIAILDTGLGRNHDDLQANIVGGHNVTSSNSGDWVDQHGHGTHCAGIAAADDETDTAIRGVAPDANLWGVKVLQDDGSGYLSDILAGIDWCRQQDIEVMSLSLGWGTHYDEVRDVLAGAYTDGHFIAAAAGNNHNNQDGQCEERNLTFPAIYPSVVATGATTKRDEIAAFSSVGTNMELVAPGLGIPSTDIGNSYSRKSGTSMATPHIAGSAAVHLQAEDTPLSPAARDSVRETFRETAENLDLGCQSGNGLVRPDKQLPFF